MKLRCPGCGAVFSLELVLAHEGAREALALAFEIDKQLGKALLKYLTLHRPQQRELSMDRAASLLAELLPQIKMAQVTRDGITRAAPLILWLEAMAEMQQRRDEGKLETPLKGHGYLLEVVARKAAKAAGQQEKADETALQYRYRQEAKKPGKGAMPEGWADKSKLKL